MIEWFTTKQASENLNISQVRVRQLISKHRNNKEFVKQKDTLKSKYYLVSHLFIQASRNNNIKFKKELINVGEPIYQEDGNILEAFEPEQYELFKKTLNEYNELKGRVNDLSKIEEEHQSHIESLKDQIKDLLAQRDYLQKSLDSKQADTTKLIDVMSQRNFIEAKEKKMK